MNTSNTRATRRFSLAVLDLLLFAFGAGIVLALPLAGLLRLLGSDAFMNTFIFQSVCVAGLAVAGGYLMVKSRRAKVRGGAGAFGLAAAVPLALALTVGMATWTEPKQTLSADELADNYGPAPALMPAGGAILAGGFASYAAYADDDDDDCRMGTAVQAAVLTADVSSTGAKAIKAGMNKGCSQ